MMTICLDDKETLKTAKKTLSKYELCNHCLGRLFANIETGLTNEKRGQLIRNNLKKSKKTEIKNCWLCSGLFDEIPHFTDIISDSLKRYEYETFLVGSKIDEDIINREQELFDFAGSKYSESIKTELNREIGKILEKRLKKEVDFENPTIIAVIDTSFDIVNLQVSSLYIYGRYKKYKRDMPQTRWFCKICWGKGCKRCHYTGKLYAKSVEELIAKRFLEETKGDSESFHGCGREDVDVRMLGNGRPFVLEIKNPKVRKIDLSELEVDINVINRDYVEISNLRFADRSEIIRLKSAGLKKIYRIVFRGEEPINKEKLINAVQSLRGQIISQFTPSRVAHRRANMVRKKHIYNSDIESVDGATAILTLETESGTYIKELISGDQGRTKPNISDMIGISCKVIELDVIGIMGE